MSPTVVAGRDRRGGTLRQRLARRPFLTTGIAGFVLGFIAVALYLVPGAMARSASAVPNVVGLLYNDAAARLTAAGFSVKIGESLNHATAPRNSVLGQNPAPGVKSLKGNEVVLDISLGAKRGTVPNVIGLSRSDAITEIEAAGFDTPREFIEKLDQHPRGEVLATLPRGGATVPQPSTVRLTVSAGPDAIGVPSLVGMPVEDALALLGQLGLTPGATRTDSSSSQPDGFVSAQRPGASAPIVPGGTVTLTVSHPRAPRDSVAP
ncbi:MAG: PASTA domain-containing protein [Gemmatimonadaceae bacterium]|nr:PASTA domain-containing protein [Gemmatimonadaceae bacterium]